MEFFWLIVYIVVIGGLSIFNFSPKQRARRKAGYKAQAEQAERVNRELELAGIKTYPAKFKKQIVFVGPIFYAFAGWFIANLLKSEYSSGVVEDFMGVLFGGLIGFLVAIISLQIANTAERKGRSFLAFFMLSLLFSPIIMGVISATMSPDARTAHIGQGASVKTAKTASTSSTSSKLKELQELLDSGLITQKEFDNKKKSILENL